MQRCFEDKNTPVVIRRDFTCECSSINAEVLFLKSSYLSNILRMHDTEVICNLFKERRVTLERGLLRIEEVGQIIEAGNPKNIANFKKKTDDEAFLRKYNHEDLGEPSKDRAGSPPVIASNEYYGATSAQGINSSPAINFKSPLGLSSGVDLRHLASSTSNERPIVMPAGSQSGHNLARVRTAGQADSSTVIFQANTQHSNVQSKA